MLSAHEAWRVTLGQLQTQLDPAKYETWLKGSDVLTYEDGEFVIRVQHAYAKDWLTKHLKRQITQILGDIMQRTVRVNFTVFLRHEETVDETAGPLFAVAKHNYPHQLELFQVGTLAHLSVPVEMPSQAGGTQLVNRPVQVAATQPQSRPFPDYSEWDPRFNDIRHTSADNGSSDVTQFNTHYSFETLAVGPENRFAVLAAQEAATKSDHLYNPLVIHGGVGLGKTHLLHAIGGKSEATGRKALYVTAETFTNDMVEAIQERKTGEFRERYRQIDVLLVDDIQFIAGKSKSEEEFYHTLNSIVSSGGQVVIVSDQHPSAIARLDKRLRARLEGGLMVDVHPPEYHTRRAILQSKAREKGIHLPNDVADLLAQQPVSNVRELSGLLKQVIARATLINQPLTPEWAETVLDTRNVLTASNGHARTLTIKDILQAVADQFGVTVADLCGKNRTKAITHARHIAMYLARDITEASYPSIGEELGGRSHSTIVYGYKKIAGLLDKDGELNNAVAAVRHALDHA